MKSWAIILFLWAAPLWGDASLDMNPGEMGPNALPSFPNADPVVGDDVLVEIRATAQAEGASDVAGMPYFRIVVPFNSVAAAEVDGSPFELWRKGISPADLRFGARFFVIPEGERLPALGVRVMVKTNTGKDQEFRRFTDAPAYAADAIAGKNIYVDDGFIRRVRLLAKFGFLIWQQGVATQNDAWDYGATALVDFADGTKMQLEWRGYAGYEDHDKPMILGLSLSRPLNRYLDWAVTANAGLTPDAPAWEIRAGVSGHIRAPRFEPPHWWTKLF